MLYIILVLVAIFVMATQQVTAFEGLLILSILVGSGTVTHRLRLIQEALENPLDIVEVEEASPYQNGNTYGDLVN